MSNPNDQINQASQQQGKDQQQGNDSKKKPSGNQPARKGKSQRFVVGDACPEEGCPGRMTVLSQIRLEKQRVRYLVCSTCKKAPRNNKQVVSLY